ncbi:hypothetical protein [Gloeocapsa sp. PCC 73106]|uniref:dual OB domain-containing protein n=1 Tax=Gloeocapsa sp. PCC 73106 TaxID=102232 RepID=UPI0002ABFCF9|nr:hypothetical protein [Gloeocapsa sp. PCC 73106]ELR99338.1 hypothetical protein GLO73106DRAFT_00031880 [Gloeocapsa sp. PCC 73106]
MPTFQILCLANSYKCQGRCIAGLRRDGKGWIRPVSSHIHGALSPEEYQLANQAEPKLLDVIEIDFIRALPEVHQPENWVISKTPWRFISCFETVSLAQKQAVRNFLNDIAIVKPHIFSDFDRKIEYSSLLAYPVTSSLVLIRPEKLSFKIISPYKPKIKACFYLQEYHYFLPVTDPNFIAKIQHLPEGNYPVAELAFPEFNPEYVFFTISLGEPYLGYCYKLAAGVISI